jgi:hypothetical protein
MLFDYVSGNLQPIQQITVLYRDPNRLMHSVSTGECGDTVTNFEVLRLIMILRYLRAVLSHMAGILAPERRSLGMISLCCTLPAPDCQEFRHEEDKVFCKQVYLLRKRGFHVQMPGRSRIEGFWRRVVHADRSTSPEGGSDRQGGVATLAVFCAKIPASDWKSGCRVMH